MGEDSARAFSRTAPGRDRNPLANQGIASLDATRHPARTMDVELVTEPGNALQALVVRRLIELGEGTRRLSYKAAEARSGGLVSHETIRKVAMGRQAGRMDDDKLKGLAKALGVPLQEVYEAAGTPRPASRWLWPPRFDNLSDPERELMESMASALLAAYDRGFRDGRRATRLSIAPNPNRN